MATKTGNIYAGSQASSGYTFDSPRSANISLGTGEYPNGTVSISGGAWYLGYGATGTSYSYDLYLCDSNGSNSSKIGTLSINGQATKNGVTFSANVSNSGLAGKALYLKVTGSNASQLVFMNTMTITVNTANSYVASTFSAANVNFGALSTVNISNSYISNLKHTVVWKVGSHTHSVTTAVGATKATYTIPASWMDAATTSTYATLQIQVSTYSGNTQIGSTASKNYRANVPESIVPTIESITAAVYNAVSGFSGTYIQGKTGATFTLNNAAPGDAYGSTITTYTLTSSQPETHTRNSNVFTVSTLQHSGDITFTATVTDSRGRTSAAKTVTISVESYSAPLITSTDVYRCTQAGVADENGTYASIICNATYSEITGNSLTINSKYYMSSTPDTKITAQNNMVSGTTYIVGSGNLDPSYTYYIEFTATDTIGETTTVTVAVQTAAYSIHVKNGGNGVAFGKTSEIANAVEITSNWDFYYKGTLMETVISGLITTALTDLVKVVEYTYEYGTIANDTSLIITAANFGISTPTGYTPVAILSFSSGSTYVACHSARPDSDNYTMYIRNESGQTAGSAQNPLVARLTVMYIKSGCVYTAP